MIRSPRKINPSNTETFSGDCVEYNLLEWCISEISTAKPSFAAIDMVQDTDDLLALRLCLKNKGNDRFLFHNSMLTLIDGRGRTYNALGIVSNIDASGINTSIVLPDGELDVIAYFPKPKNQANLKLKIALSEQKRERIIYQLGKKRGLKPKSK